MSTVDVQTEVVIHRRRREVASYAMDPDHATSWYRNIQEVEWKSEPPLAVGSRIAFVARFLGRELRYTYEVAELVPDQRFVMRTSDGVPMDTTYTWDDVADGTRITLRNWGEPSGFTGLAAPVMARAMRAANRKDLRQLQRVLEADTAGR